MKAALALLLLVASASVVAARPVKFCDLCAGYTISKRGDDVLIRCPGVSEPWMTIKACRNPKVTRHSNGDVTISCN